MKAISSTAVLSTLLLAPTLAQAHPGHSAFDPSAGAPHAGHAMEWAGMLLFVALTGVMLGLRAMSERRR